MNISKMNNVTIISDNGVYNVTQINGKNTIKVNGGFMVFKSISTSPVTIRINNKTVQIDGSGLQILKIKGLEIINKEQINPKKTTTQKRLIAGQIALYCMCFTVFSVLPGMVARNIYDKDIRKLDDKQNAIYEEFMASSEFSETFKAEFIKVSQDYTNGLITYEEFAEKVKHLNSVKYASEVLANSNNTELKTQVENINQQKQERTDEYGSSVAVNLSLGAVGVGSASTIAAIAANMIYVIKESNEEKRKKKENKISCNENCLGTRYYDSNSMTIRNTNGKYEDTYYDYTETLIPNPIKNNNEDTLTK